MLRVKSTTSESILLKAGWKKPGHEHWVLVTGVKDGIIYIADPGYNIDQIPVPADNKWYGFYITEGIIGAQIIKYY